MRKMGEMKIVRVLFLSVLISTVEFSLCEELQRISGQSENQRVPQAVNHDRYHEVGSRENETESHKSPTSPSESKDFNASSNVNSYQTNSAPKPFIPDIDEISKVLRPPSHEVKSVQKEDQFIGSNKEVHDSITVYDGPFNANANSAAVPHKVEEVKFDHAFSGNPANPTNNEPVLPNPKIAHVPLSHGTFDGDSSSENFTSSEIYEPDEEDMLKLGNSTDANLESDNVDIVLTGLESALAEIAATKGSVGNGTETEAANKVVNSKLPNSTKSTDALKHEANGDNKLSDVEHHESIAPMQIPDLESPFHPNSLNETSSTITPPLPPLKDANDNNDTTHKNVSPPSTTTTTTVRPPTVTSTSGTSPGTAKPANRSKLWVLHNLFNDDSESDENAENPIHQFFVELKIHTLLCLISLLIILLGFSIVFSFFLALFLLLKHSCVWMFKGCRKCGRCVSRGGRKSSHQYSNGIHDSTGSLFPRCDVNIRHYDPAIERRNQ